MKISPDSTETTPMDDLKPCPFCAGTARHEQFPTRPGEPECHHVRCLRGSCRGYSSYSYPSHEDAVKGWNTRAESTRITHLETELALHDCNPQETGDLCGGCTECLLKQARHYADTVARKRDSLRLELEQAKRERDEAQLGEERGHRNFCALADVLGLEIWSEEELVDAVRKQRTELAQRTRELEEVKASRDGFKEAFRKAVEENCARLAKGDTTQAQLAEVRAKLDKLGEAFQMHGRHLASCKACYLPGAPCDCGYTAALADTQKGGC